MSSCTYHDPELTTRCTVWGEGTTLASALCYFLCILFLCLSFFFHNNLMSTLFSNFFSIHLFYFFVLALMKALSYNFRAFLWLWCVTVYSPCPCFTPCLRSYCPCPLCKGLFVIITQYLIISLLCLSQCLIGLLVTFPLHYKEQSRVCIECVCVCKCAQWCISIITAETKPPPVHLQMLGWKWNIDTQRNTSLLETHTCTRAFRKWNEFWHAMGLQLKG